jgi:4-amino-4-deoxy-L-arabinose transferase-like glycosyltransferase
MNVQNKSTTSFFQPNKSFFVPLIAILFLLGLGIRLYDLTDPPLGTRQLRSAVIARGMYYQTLSSAPEWMREIAVRQFHEEAIIEPPLIEMIVASLYHLVGGEYLWLARLVSSTFWLIAGIAIYALARDMGFPDGGIVSVVYFLFLPFAILESRTFQPDPLMVSLITIALWSIYRWYQRQTWGMTVLAGMLTGLAIFSKTVAAFPLLAAWAGILIAGVGLRRALIEPKIWLMNLLILLPTLIYYVYGTFISGFLIQQFSLRFFPDMLTDPAFYVRWMQQIGYRTGFGAFMLALVGLLLLRRREQLALGVGLLLGYLVYGLSFPFHITTHDYYQLPLVPIIALLLAPVAEAVFHQLAAFEKLTFLRLAFVGILIFGLVFTLWDVRVTLARRDDRQEYIFWEYLAEKLGRESAVIGMTQDYGYRLAYFGWLRPAHWFISGDFQLRELAGQDADDIFDQMAGRLHGKDYFLITLFNEFDNQPQLKSLLYDHYQVYDEGPGYLIFDLKKPTSSPH